MHSALHVAADNTGLSELAVAVLVLSLVLCVCCLCVGGICVARERRALKKYWFWERKSVFYIELFYFDSYKKDGATKRLNEDFNLADDSSDEVDAFYALHGKSLDDETELQVHSSRRKRRNK